MKKTEFLQKLSLLNIQSPFIDKALGFAEIIYYGEKRKNQQDWLEFNLDVANLLLDLKMDEVTLAASILCDGFKFGLDLTEVEISISPEVANLLKDFRQIGDLSTKINLDTFNAQKADYIRRLILATGKDVRAVVLRLVKKLVSLNSIGVHSDEAQQLALSKAFDIYAPLADLLGIYELKWRFEDAAFKIQSPDLYDLANTHINKHFYASPSVLLQTIDFIKSVLDRNNIEFVNVLGRKKAVYSFYKKSLRYSKKYKTLVEDAMNSVKDKVAFMVLLNSEDDLYKTLDIFHQNFKWVPEDFDDYVANPKPNGYRSLQTTLELNPGHYAEIQIKTLVMHEYNEYGPASHFYYKLVGSKSNVSADKITKLKNLLTWKDSFEKDNILPDIQSIEPTIFVFTPKGDLLELDKDSTPIDFAYHIHTDLGTKAVRSFVNNIKVPLNHVLKSGDIVNIDIEKKKKLPDFEWLHFVKTKTAKYHIKKAWLSKHKAY